MKKFLGLIVYAAVMFGVTAGLGMFMLKKSAPHATDAAHDEEGKEGEHESAEDGHSSEVASSGHRTSAHGSEDSSHGNDGHGTSDHEPKRTAAVDEQLPVAVRATPMSVEEIVRMGLSLKSRDETVRKREATLKEMEGQQKLAAADILTAQQEIENLLAQASDQRAATQELLARITDQERTLTNERAAIAAERQKLNEDLAKLETDKKAFTSKEESLKASTEELSLKRKELDLAQQALNADREQYVKDFEKLNKQRTGITDDKQANETERDKLAQEKKRLEEERKQLENDRKSLPKTTPDSGSSAISLAETTKMFENVQPERAAAILKSMSASQGMDQVIELLLAMDKKKAALIIDAIDDDQFAADLAIKISNRNAAVKAAEK